MGETVKDECVFTIHVMPGKDVPGTWVGHCLEFDVVSQGNSMGHALQMTAEASALIIEWDHEEGLDPFERGPVKPWTGERE